MLRWKSLSEVHHAHKGPFQATHCQLLMIPKQGIGWCFCDHHPLVQEFTSLERSPGHRPFLTSVTLVYSWELIHAFCVWYLVSSLHSIYFVIKFLLRMIYFKGKEKIASESHSSVSGWWMSGVSSSGPRRLQATCEIVGLRPLIKMHKKI